MHEDLLISPVNLIGNKDSPHAFFTPSNYSNMLLFRGSIVWILFLKIPSLDTYSRACAWWISCQGQVFYIGLLISGTY